MRIQIASRKEFCAGLIFACIGVFALIVSRNYSLGSATRMGPGYFPLCLSLLLIGLGTASVVRSVKTTTAAGEPIGHWPLVPLSLVLFGVISFGFLIDRAGLIPAVIALLVFSCYHGIRSRPLEVLVIAVVLTAMAAGVFVYALGMPFVLIRT